jgi:hypothetical protein
MMERRGEREMARFGNMEGAIRSSTFDEKGKIGRRAEDKGRAKGI